MADRGMNPLLDRHLRGGSGRLGLQPVGQGGVGAEHGQLVHHPGGIGGRMSAEGPAHRVAEAVTRAMWRSRASRTRPAGRNPAGSESPGAAAGP